jgi:hypothetical protein
LVETRRVWTAVRVVPSGPSRATVVLALARVRREFTLVVMRVEAVEAERGAEVRRVVVRRVRVRQRVAVGRRAKRERGESLGRVRGRKAKRVRLWILVGVCLGVFMVRLLVLGFMLVMYTKSILYFGRRVKSLNDKL